MITFISFILMLSPPAYDGIIYDTSDFVEINHLYRYNSEKKALEKQLVQIIWWEFRGGLFTNRKGEPLNRPFSDFVVKDFRVIWSETSSPKDIYKIVPRYYNGNWLCIFYDKHHRVLRQVKSKWNKISHTSTDPEMENRKILNMERRTGLTRESGQ
tara:strand:- start:1322 stop:1789 length:468 start_codon:yes stop_codon:yes gene_type:complete